MGKLGLLMIHNCMSYLGYANSNQMRKAADDNDVINQSSIEAYKAVTGLPETQIRELMDQTTWMTAQQALEYGFATEIAEQEDDETTQQSAFRQIRDAVLQAQQPALPAVDLSADMAEVKQSLAELGTKLDALQAASPAKKPEGNIYKRNFMKFLGGK